jgi:GNAT superfamily N-acetyltransferase
MQLPTRISDEDRILFRRGVPADAEALVALASKIYYETFASTNTRENMEAYLSTAFTVPQFEADLNNSQVLFHLAEAGGGLIGYAKLVAGEAPECIRIRPAIEIERFYLERRWHGSGIATTLMDACLSDARRLAFKTVYLGVWEQNLRAQAFYRKWGFVRVGQHIFQMGDDPQVDWWMALHL